MLYRPRLANGKPAPLAWPLVLYRLANSICWPLEDNASRFTYGYDRFVWISGFIIFVVTNEAEFRYLRVNVNNLDAMLTGIPTYLVLIEIHLRGYSLGLGKEKLKQLLKKFYAEIYIEKSVHPKHFKDIQRKYALILIFSGFYLCTLVIYVTIPIYLLMTGSRELLYKMIPFFNYEPLYLYLPTMFTNIWVGFIVATMIFGEANLLSLQIFHLNGRYILMKENLMCKVEKLLESKRNDDIVQRFRQVLVTTINENAKLNAFAQELQHEFSFRIFIIFSFLAASLCAMGFKVYTSPMTSIGYMFWFVGKCIETIAYGEMGSTIITTTEAISSMYYESKWELIIERSTDTNANVHLMKLINLAILLNRKPFSLAGLNFFQVSLTSSVAILQVAFSYFTCLVAVR